MEILLDENVGSEKTPLLWDTDRNIIAMDPRTIVTESGLYQKPVPRR